MSSAVCTLALVLGLTLGGHCTAPPEPVVAASLPPDDPAAWALPKAPEPPPVLPW